MMKKRTFQFPCPKSFSLNPLSFLLNERDPASRVNNLWGKPDRISILSLNLALKVYDQSS